MQKKILVSTLMLGTLLFTGAGCSLGGSSSAPTTTGPAGIFTSSDKGETWKQSSVFPTVDGVKSLQTVSAYEFINDPLDSNTFYWASRGNGLFYTTDGAVSWNRAPAPLNTGFIYSVAVHPQDHCTVYASIGKNVYRSTDCLRSWSEVYREDRTDSVRAIVINPFTPFQVSLVKGSGDILQSNDAGVSWTVLARLKKSVYTMVADPQKEGRYYMATATNGLFRSDDGAKTWTDLSKALRKFPGALTYRDMTVYTAKEDTVYWISTYGILRSEDAGQTWTPFQLITPPGSAKIYAFGVNPKNEKEIYYTATIGTRSSFYKSINGGQNWITKKLPSGQIPTVIRLDPKKESVVYLGFTIPPQK